MSIRLRHTAPITIWSCYAPPAPHAEAEHRRFYDQLRHSLLQTPSNGISILCGDFNARIQKATSSAERNIIGKHTFDAQHANPHQHKSPEVQASRQRFLEFCLTHQLVIRNTWFQHRDPFLATYMAPGPNRSYHTWRKPRFDTLEYVLIPNKW